MIIDIVISSILLGKGGTENVVKTAYQYLHGKGYRVRVFIGLTPIYKDYINNFEECYIFSVDKGPAGGLDFERLYKGYRLLIDNIGYPDVIIETSGTNSYNLCEKAIDESDAVKRPKVISWLHGDLHSYNIDIELMSGRDGYICVCDENERFIRDVIGEDNVITVGNPCRLGNILRTPVRRGLYVYIGRMSNFDKRIDIMLKALSLLKYDWQIDMFCDKGRDMKLIEDKIAELGIYDNVKWKGFIDDPLSTYKEFKPECLLLSSDTESFGLCMVEAASYGIPVISTNTSGGKMVVNKDNGILFPKGDYVKLSNILTKVYNGEIKLPSPSSCRNSVLEYDVNNVMGKVEKFILKTIGYEEDDRSC